MPSRRTIVIKGVSVHALASTQAPSALRRMRRRELPACGLAVGIGLIVVSARRSSLAAPAPRR